MHYWTSFWTAANLNSEYQCCPCVPSGMQMHVRWIHGPQTPLNLCHGSQLLMSAESQVTAQR